MVWVDPGARIYHAPHSRRLQQPLHHRRGWGILSVLVYHFTILLKIRTIINKIQSNLPLFLGSKGDLLIQVWLYIICSKINWYKLWFHVVFHLEICFKSTLEKTEWTIQRHRQHWRQTNQKTIKMSSTELTETPRMNLCAREG